MWARKLRYGVTDYTYTFFVCDSHKSFLEHVTLSGVYRFGPLTGETIYQINVEEQCLHCRYPFYSQAEWREMAGIFVKITSQPVIYEGFRYDEGSYSTTGKEKSRRILRLLEKTRGSLLAPIWKNAVGQLYLLKDLLLWRRSHPIIRCKLCNHGVVAINSHKYCSICEREYDKDVRTWVRYLEKGRIPLVQFDVLCRVIKSEDTCCVEYWKNVIKEAEDIDERTRSSITVEAHS